MAINFDLLTSRLRQFETGAKMSKTSQYVWKPKEGIQDIRIVPYKHNPESPFMELKFYYGLGGRTYLAPCTFGKPDPVAELVESFRGSPTQAHRELARKLEAKPRTYVPITVRKEESQGVKFWGFGATVFKQLLKLITNPDWGDITSLTEGNDLQVEFHKISNKKHPNGQVFPETIITPRPKKTPAFDLKNVELQNKIINEQPDVFTIWDLPSYDDLKLALDKYINPEAHQGSAPSPASSNEEAVDETTGADETESQSAVEEPDFDNAFKEFFNRQ